MARRDQENERTPRGSGGAPEGGRPRRSAREELEQRRGGYYEAQPHGWSRDRPRYEGPRDPEVGGSQSAGGVGMGRRDPDRYSRGIGYPSGAQGPGPDYDWGGEQGDEWGTGGYGAPPGAGWRGTFLRGPPAEHDHGPVAGMPFAKANRRAYGLTWETDAGLPWEEGQHRGRGPKGYRRPNHLIREEVCDLLADDDWIDAGDMEVRVEGGEVYLEGTAPDRRTKRMAEDVASMVRGVKDVHNWLRVQREEDVIRDRRRGPRETNGEGARSEREP